MHYLFELAHNNPCGFIFLCIFVVWLVLLFFTPFIEGEPTKYEEYHDGD